MNQKRVKEFFENKTVRYCFIGIVALFLLFAVWKVFFQKENSNETSVIFEYTREETRLCGLLSKIQGVDSATVHIKEDAGKAQSVVVIFSGSDGVLVRSNILNVTSSALGLDKGKIQIYPSEK